MIHQASRSLRFTPDTLSYQTMSQRLVSCDPFCLYSTDEISPVIPYTRTFREGEHRHLIVQATILSMTANSVTVSYASPPSGNSSDPSAAILEEFRQHTIPFEFAVYALGASLPQPINVWEPFDKPVPKYSEQAEQEQKVSSASRNRIRTEYCFRRSYRINSTDQNARQWRGSKRRNVASKIPKA